MRTVPLHETPEGAKPVDWRRYADDYYRRIKSLEMALKWYADSENYNTNQDCPDVLIDGGNLARRTLAE